MNPDYRKKDLLARIQAERKRLEEISDEFKSSYQKILTTVQGMSPEDPFTSRRFPWTGKFILAAFAGANTYPPLRLDADLNPPLA